MKVYRLGMPGYHGGGSQVGMDGPTLKVGDIQSTFFNGKCGHFPLSRLVNMSCLVRGLFYHPGHIEAEPHFVVWFHRNK